MTTAHWKAAVSGNFADAAAWSTGAVPGQFDTADLDASGEKYSVASNNSSTGTIVGALNISSNACLNIFGSKGLESYILSKNSTVNDGTIKIGVDSGGSGALFGGLANSPVVNNSLIVVKADGNLTAELQNNGVVQLVGGFADIFANSNQNGKYRIDGGHLFWSTSNYLGTVNFNGPNGGEFEMGYGPPNKKKDRQYFWFRRNRLDLGRHRQLEGLDHP